MTSSYLEAARQRVVIFDGAMGTGIQELGLTADDFGGPDLEGCNELLVVTRPEMVRQLHAAYLDVGCDVLETDTFGAFAVPLAEYGIADRTYELNLAAARIAKDVADRLLDPRPPPLGVGLDRAGHQVRLARPDPVRRPARPVRGAEPGAARRAASTC